MNYRDISHNYGSSLRFDSIGFYKLLPIIQENLGDSSVSILNQESIDNLLQCYFPEFVAEFGEGSELTIEDMLLSCLGWMNRYSVHKDYEALLALAFSYSSYGNILRERIAVSSEFESDILKSLDGNSLPEIIDTIVAVQLTDGCSVGCSFCTLSPGKLSKDKFSISDILLLISRYYPECKPKALYHASDPFDWKGTIKGEAIHYGQLHFLIMMLGGYIPFVSTAMPRDSESVIRDVAHLVHRISVSSKNRHRLEVAFGTCELETGESYEGLDLRTERTSLGNLFVQKLGTYEIVPNLRATDPLRLKPQSKVYQNYSSHQKAFLDTPVACVHGVILSPNREIGFYNYFAFSKLPQDVEPGSTSARGYLNIVPDFSRFDEPFPGREQVGNHRYKHNQGILCDILKQGVLVPLHRDADGIFRLVQKYGDGATPFSIRNHTGIAHYIFITESIDGKERLIRIANIMPY